jgi:hypothetical protein
MRRCKEMAKKGVEIELTPEQKKNLKKATGKDVPAVKLRPEPLEQRVAPRVITN